MNLIAITSMIMGKNGGNVLIGLGNNGEMYLLDCDVVPFIWRKVKTTVEITHNHEEHHADKN